MRFICGCPDSRTVEGSFFLGEEVGKRRRCFREGVQRNVMEVFRDELCAEKSLAHHVINNLWPTNLLYVPFVGRLWSL